MDVMLKVEQNMLQAAFVSWVITHVMDKLLVILSSIRNLNQPHLKHALLRGSALTASYSAISSLLEYVRDGTRVQKLRQTYIE